MDNVYKIGWIINPSNNEKLDSQLFITESSIFFSTSIDCRVIKYDLLLGTFLELGRVTLIDCTLKSHRSGGNISYSEYNVKYLITNIHIDSLTNLRFKKVKVTIPSLSEWFDKQFVDISHKEVETTFSVKNSEKFMLVDFDKFKIYSEIYYLYKLNKKSLRLSEHSVIFIESNNEEIELDDLFLIINKFKQFLLIITKFSPNIENVYLYKEDNLNEYESFELLYNYKVINLDNTFNYNEIKYSEIKKNIQFILYKWFNNQEIQTSIELISEKFFNSGQSRENYFLNSCFAIEIFHQTHINKKQMSFLTRLNYFKKDFERLLHETINVENYLKKIVDTRNFLVHRSEREDIFKGIDLYYAAKYIETLIRIHILILLEVSDELLESQYDFASKVLPLMYNLNKNNFRSTLSTSI